jgi:hypothetical protein
MAAIVMNVAKGRVVELYRRVKANDPANSALVLVPIEAAGVESDAVLRDKLTLADFLSGTTNEQTTMGRKVLSDAELAAFPGPDTANDRYDVSAPLTTWIAATGNAIGDILVCYDPDTTGGTDSDLIPLTLHDYVLTPDGTDAAVLAGIFFRGS